MSDLKKTLLPAHLLMVCMPFSQQLRSSLSAIVLIDMS